MKAYAVIRLIFAATLCSMLSPAAKAQGQTIIVPYESIRFAPQAPGSKVQVANLWGDRSKGNFGMLMKFPGGYVGSLHSHTGEYHGINLKGTWIHVVEGKSVELPENSYVRQAGKEPHSDACKGPEDCVILIHQQSQGDYIPVPEKD